VSTFCAGDGKNKLFDLVAKIATEAWDIDEAMKAAYEMTK